LNNSYTEKKIQETIIDISNFHYKHIERIKRRVSRKFKTKRTKKVKIKKRTRSTENLIFGGVN